jgi:hypothetical protein
MQQEIGATAGMIWQMLDRHGALTLPQLKKKVGARPPLFEMGIGWLAREDKIVITPAKRTFLIYLKDRPLLNAIAS